MTGSPNAARSHGGPYPGAALLRMLLLFAAAAMCASVAASGEAEAQEGTEALSNQRTEELNAGIDELVARYDEMQSEIDRLEAMNTMEAGSEANDLSYEQSAVDDEINRLQRDLVEEKLEIVENIDNLDELPPRERVDRLEEVESALTALEDYSDSELPIEDSSEVSDEVRAWQRGAEDELDQARADLESQEQREQQEGARASGGDSGSGSADGGDGEESGSGGGFFGGLVRLLVVGAGLGVGGVVAYRAIGRYGLFEGARRSGGGGTGGGTAGAGPGSPGPGPTVGGGGAGAGGPTRGGREDEEEQPEEQSEERPEGAAGGPSPATRSPRPEANLGRANELLRESAETIHQHHGVRVSIGQGVTAKLAEQGEGGERRMRSVVEKEVEDRIQDLILSGKIETGASVELALRKDGRIGVRPKRNGG